MAEKYTREHEWIRAEGDSAAVGISEYAQQQLGDVVYVELPEVGRRLDKGDEAAVIASVKAASEVYAPAAGEVIEVNPDLETEPARINSDPLGEGWIFKIKLSDPGDLDDLMDKAAYQEYIGGLD